MSGRDDDQSVAAVESGPALIDTQAAFADQLDQLRAAADVSPRDLAAALDMPVSTIRSWLTGKRLPNGKQVAVLRALLSRLGVDDDGQEQWVQALRRARPPRARRQRRPDPYPGLHALTERDADWLFGRDAVVASVVERLRALESSSEETRVVVVSGASGVGKTSLVQAGVLPALQRDGAGSIRSVLLVCPGSEPIAALATALATATAADASTLESELRAESSEPVTSIGDVRPLVVVDQLEELVTIVRDDDERRAFLDALVRIAHPSGGASVIAVVRSDARDELLRTNGDLASVLLADEIVVAPMTSDELRAVIEGPAARAGASIEPELVDMMLRDVAGGPAPTAGALALLSDALASMWRRSRDGVMTQADYVAAGGAHGAAEAIGEEAFLRLAPHDHLAGKEVLTTYAGGGAGAGAGAERARGASPDEATVAAVTEHFVRHRVLTVDESSVALSHASLLDGWPRLRAWTDERQRSARQGSSRDGGRDGASTPGDVTSEVTEMTSGGKRARRRSRAQRRLITLTVVSLVLAQLAIAAAVLSWKALHNTRHERDEALSQRIDQEVGRLRDSDPNLAAQLSLVAYRLSKTVESRSALIDSTARAMPTRLLGNAGPTVLAASGDGQREAVSNGDAGTIQLLDLTGDAPKRTSLVHLAAKDTQVITMAMTGDGALLAAGTSDKSVTVWSLAANDPSVVATLGPFTGAVHAVAFRVDGKELAVAGADASIHRWDMSTPTAPAAVADIPSDVDVTKALAYSPDGRHLASGGTDGGLRTWDLSASAPVAQPAQISGDRDELNAVAFSPDSTHLATGYLNGRVQLLTVGDNNVYEDRGGLDSGVTRSVNAIAFSPDGSELAAGSSDGAIRSWTTDNLALRRRFDGPAPVTGLTYAAGGRTIASVSTDGATRLWHADRSPLARASNNVFSVAFSNAEQHLLAGVSSGGLQLWDASQLPALRLLGGDVAVIGDLRLSGTGALASDGGILAAGTTTGPTIVWNLADPTAPHQTDANLEGPTDLVESVASSADHKLVAVGSDDATVRLWDLAKSSRPTPLGKPFTVGDQVLGVAFDASAKLLAAASADKSVHWWDITDPAKPKSLPTLTGFTDNAQSVAFSDDGKLLAAAGADHTVRVWDITDPNAPKATGAPITGPTGGVSALDFQPGTRVLAASSADGTVWLWDMKDAPNANRVAVLRASKGAVYTTSFSADGRFLAAAGEDRTIYLWQVDAAGAMNVLCKNVGDALTKDEVARYLSDVPRSVSACPTS